VSAYRLIDAEEASYPGSVLCRALKVSRKRYYDWKDRPLSKTTGENAALTEKIGQIHDRSRQTYGYPRVNGEELGALGVRCSKMRVARLMRKAGLQGCRCGRKKRTTRRDKHATPAPDLVGRNFSCRLIQPALDSRHHLHPYSGRLSVSRLHTRCLFQEGGGLVDGKPP
jgi:putative transposase